MVIRVIVTFDSDGPLRFESEATNTAEKRKSEFDGKAMEVTKVSQSDSTSSSRVTDFFTSSKHGARSTAKHSQASEAKNPYRVREMFPNKGVKERNELLEVPENPSARNYSMLDVSLDHKIARRGKTITHENRREKEDKDSSSSEKGISDSSEDQIQSKTIMPTDCSVHLQVIGPQSSDELVLSRTEVHSSKTDAVTISSSDTVDSSSTAVSTSLHGNLKSSSRSTVQPVCTVQYSVAETSNTPRFTPSDISFLSLPRPKQARSSKLNCQTDPVMTTDDAPVKSKSGKRKPRPVEIIQKSTITDFFPVRRSGRQTKSEIENQKRHQLEQMILSQCEDGLEVIEIENKGRGVMATKVFNRGDFVVEYAGQLIDVSTARKREKLYKDDPTIGCYMYYFKCGTKQFCIDATEETGRLGRLINHSREGNCMTRVVVINSKPHLILVASTDIQVGEELSYDYGDRSKVALEAYPWLKS